MNEIVDIEGAEAREIAKQFLSQQIPFIKDLNTRIVGQASTMRPIDPNIHGIIDSIEVRQPPVQVFPSFQQPVRVVGEVPILTVPAQTVQKNPGQLEFDFSYDIAEDIVERLEKVEKLLHTVINQQDQLLGQHKITVPIKKN